MLQSIGMTTGQLKRVIICEGISYIAAAGVFSLFVETILSYAVLHSLNNVLMFFEYRFQAASYFIMLPVLLVIAIITPVVCLRQRRGESGV